MRIFMSCASFETAFNPQDFMRIFSSLFGRLKNVTLTDEEISVCEVIEYDQQLALTIKEVTKNSIELIPEVDEYAEIQETKDEGLCSKLAYRNAFDYVAKTKNKFNHKGYLLFFFEDNNKNVYLSILKGNNEVEIVKWRQTNGINFNLDNNSIISKLKEWQKLCDYQILGVGGDYIEISFSTLPEHVDEFVNDLYKFCPDIVDQGVGEISILKDELLKTKLLQLWWD